MMNPPEFEPEFYEEQINLMTERYSIYFRNWKLSWKAYYSYVSEKLRYNQYWIWIYLCGLEPFIQKNQNDKKINRTKLYEEANTRIYKIIGDYYKIRNYTDQL